MAQLDFPSSPTPGQTYAAPNGVTYTWDGTFGVWTAIQTDPLTVDSPGSISGSPVVGGTLIYATGQASGGVPPYDYYWEWRLLSNDSTLQAGGSTLTVPPSALGDKIYIYFAVTDAVLSTATGTTDAFPLGSGIITEESFPNLIFDPADGPNSSPDYVNFENLRGSATAIWPGSPSPATLTATGDIQISVNGGVYGTTGTINSNETIKVIWNPDSIAAAADNATLTGSLTDGFYKNTFTITIDRSPTGFIDGFSDLTEQSKNAQVVSNTVTPSGYNVPVTLSVTGSSTPLTSIGASVDGGAFTSSNQTVTPGQTIQLRGTTGTANTTAYGITASLGSGPAVTDTWTATTIGITPAIAQPSITAPADNATDINPALNSPPGVTITGSTYVPENGAGAHASSDWELYANGYPLTSTNTITGVTSTEGPLTPVSGLAGNAMGVTYDSSRSRFYAAGTAGNSWISTDGSTWSSIPSDHTVPLVNVASNDSGTLVAISPSGSNLLYYSTDGGSTWTLGTFASPPGERLDHVLWDGTRFVTNRYRYSDLYTSTDGINWSGPLATAWGGDQDYSKIESLVYDPSSGRIIATRGTANDNPRLAWTTNYGATWTTSSNLNSYGDPRASVAGSYVFFTEYIGSEVSYSTTGGSSLASITEQFITKPVLFWEEDGTYYAALNDNSIVKTSDPFDWINAPAVAGASLDVDRRWEIAQSPTGVAISTYSEVIGQIPTSGTGFSSSSALTTLTIANCLSDGFREQDIVVSNPAGGGPTTIVSLDNTQVVVVSPTGWLGNSTQNLEKDSSSYSLINSSTGDPTNLVSWPNAQGLFNPDTNYYTRVRYTSTDPVSSSWSAWSEFTTASSFAPSPGDAMAGGYFAGQIRDVSFNIYNLIVAPLTEGSLEGQYQPQLQLGQFGVPWKINDTGPDNAALSTWDGRTATTTYGNPNYPVFNWVVAYGFGPNAGNYDANNTLGTGIGGYNDWYIPAKDELEIIYRNLKPTTTDNIASNNSGLNDFAVPTATVPYTPTDPAQTSVAIFQKGGSQAFSSTTGYWTATQVQSSSPTADSKAWSQNFEIGDQYYPTDKTFELNARAIRRVPA